HKYFYRTYANLSWSAWVAVQPEIEGDHIVLSKWRGKLNLFWLTFAKKQQATPPPSSTEAKGVASLNFSELAAHIYSAAPQEQLLVQLNWSEYFQGQWSERLSTDINKSQPINVESGFDVRNIHVHVSTEPDDAAVRIHLDFPDKYEAAYALAVFFAMLLGVD